MKTEPAQPVDFSAPPASRKSRSRLAILPASESGRWDLFRFEGGSPSQTTMDRPEIRAAEAERTVVGWSVRQVITLPIWVAESGDAREMIALELELRGLVKPGETPTFGSDEVTREAGRVLYAVHLLADSQAVPAVSGASGHDARLRWFPPEPDAIHFWREEGLWAYGISRRGVMLYAQSLCQPQLAKAHFQGIHRVVERFLFERVLAQPPATLRFLDFAPNEQLDEASRILEATAQRLERRSPEPPKIALDLPSASVRQWRTRHEQAGRFRRIGLITALVIVVVAAVAGFALFRKQSELNQLRAEIESQGGEVSKLMEIARDWNVIEPAVNPQYYPLDILRDCAAQLPETGTRFTAVTIDASTVVIQGEAANHPAAFQFADNLKNSPALAGYEWEIPQPTLLPNNTASFQMQGLRHSDEKFKP